MGAGHNTSEKNDLKAYPKLLMTPLLFLEWDNEFLFKSKVLFSLPAAGEAEQAPG